MESVGGVRSRRLLRVDPDQIWFAERMTDTGSNPRPRMASPGMYGVACLRTTMNLCWYMYDPVRRHKLTSMLVSPAALGFATLPSCTPVLNAGATGEGRDILDTISASEYLGHGAAGHVFKAMYKGKEVAIKVITCSSTEKLERCRQ